VCVSILIMSQDSASLRINTSATKPNGLNDYIKAKFAFKSL